MQKLDRAADLQQDPGQQSPPLPQIPVLHRQVQRPQRDPHHMPHVRLVLFQNQQPDELQALCIISFY